MDKEPLGGQYVLISRQRLGELCEDAATLQFLIEVGVENWVGFNSIDDDKLYTHAQRAFEDAIVQEDKHVFNAIKGLAEEYCNKQKK